MNKNIVIGGLVVVIIAMGAFIVADVAQAPEDSVETPRNGVNGEMNDAMVSNFKAELEEAVRDELGQPIEGYEPFMFMAVFENLTPEDFDGVDASIGHYTYINGELQHDLEGETMLHSAAGAITETGMAILLTNVIERLDIDSTEDVDRILEQLDEVDTSDGEEGDGPVACTMDAKLCPDGSYVGRVGPDCEFAQCPASEATVCTQEMKQAEVCAQVYQPVCGLVEVQCITEPCDPVPETFSNPCTACSQGNVVSFTEGQCEI